MKRRLASLLATALLLAGIAVATFWIKDAGSTRSREVELRWAYADGRGVTTLGVYQAFGSVFLGEFTKEPSIPSLGSRYEPFVSGISWRTDSRESTGFYCLGMLWEVHGRRPLRNLPMYGSFESRPADEAYSRGAILSLPTWLVLVALLLYPAIWIEQIRRRRWRASHGRCVKCGYDLRASVDRCPECGTPRTSGHSSL